MASPESVTPHTDYADLFETFCKCREMLESDTLMAATTYWDTTRDHYIFDRGYDPDEFHSLGIKVLEDYQFIKRQMEGISND